MKVCPNNKLRNFRHRQPEWWDADCDVAKSVKYNLLWKYRFKTQTLIWKNTLKAENRFVACVVQNSYKSNDNAEKNYLIAIPFLDSSGAILEWNW